MRVDTKAQRRNEGLAPAPIDNEVLPYDDPGFEVVELKHAIDRLRERDPLAGEIALIKLFTGASNRAIAKDLEVSARTVDREWNYAKAWLSRHLLASREVA